jgi:hypothetical protein
VPKLLVTQPGLSRGWYIKRLSLQFPTFENYFQLMAFATPPEPVSPLNRYRILSPNASVRVSPLVFGSMNLGTSWESFMGGVDKEESFKLLDYYYDQGGNFIDVKLLLVV